MDLKSVKSEYKRLKKRIKGSPGLFTRVAALELEMGKVKAAKSRLESGIEIYPESPLAHSLLAECLSQLGDHESSLKEWEDVMASEPFNQEARSGYIRELAFLERDDAMGEALSELYLIDPYNTEISNRHKELLLKDIRDKHPDERVWKEDWHPGDFTSIGAAARSIAYERGYTDSRSNLPDGFEPQIDEDILEKIIANLPEKELDTDIEAGFKEALDEDQDIEELDVDDAEAKALEALLDSDDKEELDVDDFFTQKEVKVEDVVKSVEEQTGLDYSDKNDVKSTDAQDVDVSKDELLTGKEVDEAPAAEPAKEEEDLTIVEQKKSYQPRENRLKKALENCGVKKLDDVIDLEDLIDLIVQEDIVLVEKPAIKHASEEEEDHKVTQSDLDHLLETEKTAGVAETDNGMDEIPPDLDQPLSQSDLDAILGSPEPAKEATPEVEVKPAESSGPLNQSELDALVAANKGGAKPAEPEATAVDDIPDGPLDQNALDALVAASKQEKAPAPKPAEDEPSGPLSQSELDALVAANKNAPGKVEKEDTSGGSLNQDDLDALIAARKEAPAEPSGSLNQDELDKIIAANKKAQATEAPASEPAKEEPSGPLSQSELDALVAANKGGAKPAEPEATTADDIPDGPLDQNALDALVAASKQKKAPASEPAKEEPSGPLSQSELDALVAANKGGAKPAEPEATTADDIPDGPLDQNALDALVAASKKDTTPAPEPAEKEPSGPLSQDELNKLVAAQKEESTDEEEIKQEEEKEPESISELDDLEGPLDQNVLDNLIQEHKSDHPEAEERSNISKMAEKLRDKLKESGVDNLEEIPVVPDEESININQEVIDSITKTKSPFEDDVTQDDLTTAIDENLQAIVENEGSDPENLSDQDELNNLMKKMKESGDDSDVLDKDKPPVKVGTLSLDELQSHLGGGKGIEFTIETRDEGEEVTKMDKVAEKSEKYDDQDKVDELITDKEKPAPETKPEAIEEVETIDEVPVSGKPALVGGLPKPDAIKRERKKPPVREEETKPKELKGPVSKTFARLCMAQGKFKHAAEILNRLEEKTPDDPEIAKLKEEVLQKI